MKKYSILPFILICLILSTPLNSSAQAPGFDQDTNDVPIDGGLSILLAAGIGYGIKRKFKQEDQAEKK